MEEFEKIKAKIAELQGKYESSEDKKNGLIHERETLENDRGKVKDEFQNIQKEVSELRAQVRTAKAETKKVQSSKDVQERSKREKQKSLESVQKVLAETKSRYYVSLLTLTLSGTGQVIFTWSDTMKPILNSNLMIPDIPHNIIIRLAQLNFFLLLRPDVALSLPFWLS